MAGDKRNNGYIRKTSRVLTERLATGVCAACGDDFSYARTVGQPRKYCSTQCVVAAERRGSRLADAQRGPCSTKGCKNLAQYNEGICNACYCRRRRTGTIEIRAFGARYVANNGYVVLTAGLVNGHPVQSGSGQAYEHRKVLFDSIGPGVHRCHWCGSLVQWGKRTIKKDADVGRLVVDHLDGDKLNNDIGNLVPACQRCNANRGLFMAWVRDHKDDPVLWGMYQQAKDAA